MHLRSHYRLWVSTLILLAAITPVGFFAFQWISAQGSPEIRDRNRVIFVAGICTDSPIGTEGNPKTFWEIFRWLADDLGYEIYTDINEPADIYGFSYATDDVIEINPEAISYNPDLTDQSIATVHAPRLRDMILRLRQKYPGERFDIISHSMGGIVSLYAAANYPVVKESLRSILTINSPVQGIGGARELISGALFPCVSFTSDALDDMDNAGPVISAIKNTNWNDAQHDSLFVATIANECDLVVTTLTDYPGGDLGILDTADYQNTFVADSSGCSLLDVIPFPNIDKLKFEHKAPLLVNSNPAAEPTKDAILQSLLTNWEIPGAFLSPPPASRFVKTPELPDLLDGFDQSHAYMANESLEFQPDPTQPDILTRFIQTQPFLANESGELQTDSQAPGIDSTFSISNAFIGNGSLHFTAPIAEPDITTSFAIGVCGDLNGDDIVNVFDAIILLQIAVGLILPTPDQMVLGDLNQDGEINIFDAIIGLQIVVGLTTVSECGLVV